MASRPISDLQDHQHSLRVFLLAWLDEQDMIVKAAERVITGMPQDLPRREESSNSLQRPAAAAIGAEPAAQTLEQPLEAKATFERSSSDVVGDEINQQAASVVLAQLTGKKKKIQRMEGTVGNSVLKLDEPQLHGALTIWGVAERIDRNRFFNPICGIVVLSNAVILALQAENASIAAQNRDLTPAPGFYTITDMCFCLFYVLELAVKMVSRRLRFFTGQDVTWNLFDVLLSLTAVQEQITNLFNVDSGQNVSYLRVIRLVKTLKLLRIVRMLRAFRELRMVMDSILGSMKSMLWTACLILTVVFMFGLVFLEAVTNNIFKTLGDKPLSEKQQATWDGAKQYWDSLGTAMLSLFMASTGGLDWNELAMPLWEAGPLWYACFLFYISFFLFVVMNTLTSLFIDASVQIASTDEQTIIADNLQKKEEYMIKLAALFDMMDSDNNGAVNFQEFSEHLKNPKLQSFAESLELDVGDVHELFSVITEGGVKRVTLENFVVGCIRVRGAAKSMDMLDLSVRQRRFAEEHHRFREKAENELVAIRRLLSGLDRSGLGVAGRALPADLSPPPSVRFEHFGLATDEDARAMESPAYI